MADWLILFFASALTPQKSPELIIHFINSCIQWSVVLYLGLKHCFSICKACKKSFKKTECNNCKYQRFVPSIGNIDLNLSHLQINCRFLVYFDPKMYILEPKLILCWIINFLVRTQQCNVQKLYFFTYKIMRKYPQK